MDLTERKFIGRDDLLEDFKRQCESLQDDESKIIFYFGDPGMGKTALLKHLMFKETFMPYVYHDFDSITNMRVILKKLVRQFSRHGYEFPLFEMGCYLYEISIGENSYPPKQKSFLSDYPLLVNALGIAAATASTAVTAGLAGVILGTDTMVKAIPIVKDLVEKVCDYCLKDSEDTAYEKYVQEVTKELKLFSDKMLNESNLENELVILFAQDLAHCTRKFNRKAVIFLDSYEVLLRRGTKTKEHPAPDWWLKDDLNGLLSNVPNVLWVLSGWSRPDYAENLSSRIIQRELKPFDNQTSLKFLESRGIENNLVLCYQLAKLTRGYPLYLELCAQQYRQLKKKDKYHEPAISDFAPENEEFHSRVGKIVLNLIECMDDTGIREMIKYLCALKSWTTPAAVKIISTFNETAYNEIKNFSFIRLSDSEEAGTPTFKFDSNIQELLIAKYKQENKIVIEKTLAGVNSYYRREMDRLQKEDREFESNREDFNQNLKLWVEIVVRLVDDAKHLMSLYQRNMQTFFKHAYPSTEEELLNIIFRKLNEISSTDSLPYTFFEIQKAFVKNNSWHYGDAMELAKSARLKLKKLRATEDSTTVDRMMLDVLRVISDSTANIGHNVEDIELKKEIVDYIKVVCKDYPDRIYDAMCDYADSLSTIGEHEKSLEVKKEILAFSEKTFGSESPYTLKVIRSLAYSPDKNFNDDARLGLLRKIVEVLRNTNPTDAADAMQELADKLCYLERQEEELKVREEMWEYCRKMLGDENLDTLTSARYLSSTLFDMGQRDKSEEVLRGALNNRVKALELHISKLERNDAEALELLEELPSLYLELNSEKDILRIDREIFARRKEIFGEHDENTILAMRSLADTLESMKQNEESRNLEERIWELRIENIERFKSEYGEGHSKTIEAMSKLADMLGRHEFSGLLSSEDSIKKSINLRRQLVDITERNIGKFDCDIYHYIEALENLSDSLEKSDMNKEEVIELHKKALELCKIHLPGHQHTMDMFDMVISDYKDKNMFEEAIALQKQLVDIRMYEWGDAACETIWTLQELGDMFHKIGDYCEELKVKQEALECAKKRGFSRKQTIFAMEVVAVALKYHTNKELELLQLRRDIVAASINRFGDKSVCTAKAIELLAKLLDELSYHDEAESWRKKYDEIGIETDSEDDLMATIKRTFAYC